LLRDAFGPDALSSGLFFLANRPYGVQMLGVSSGF